MPLFVVIGLDGPDGAARRNAHRAAHRAHLDGLRRDGRLKFAGTPRTDADDASIGAVLVLEARDLAEARELAERDPFVRGGVFATLLVAPFKWVHPQPS